MSEGPDIFGPYATLIAQIVTLLSIAGIMIRLGKSLTNKRAPRDYIFFFLLIATIIGMQLVGIYNFTIQNQQLQTIEKQQLVIQNQTIKNQRLLGKLALQINSTLIQEEDAAKRVAQLISLALKNVQLNKQQIGNQNVTNAHLETIREKLSHATIVNNTTSLPFNSRFAADNR